jgi:hypothetical protein
MRIKLITIWQGLIEPSIIHSRLLCRMTVTILTELMKYFLEISTSNTLQAEEESVFSSQLMNLVPKSYSALTESIQRHPEKFPREERQNHLEKWIHFRLKQDHIGAVALQKALDNLISSFMKNKSITHSRMNLTAFILSYLFSFNQETKSWGNPPNLFEVMRNLSRNDTNQRGKFLINDLLAISLHYLFHYPRGQSSPLALPMEWTSFSIIFHSICHSLAFPIIPVCTSSASHQVLVTQNGNSVNNFNYWVLLAPTLVSLLIKGSNDHLNPGIKMKNDHFLSSLMNYLMSVCGSDHFKTSEAAEMLSTLSNQFQSCSFNVLLSVLIEIIRFLYHSFEYWQQLQSPTPESDLTHFISVLSFLQQFMALFLEGSFVSSSSGQAISSAYDLLDDVFDLFSLFYHEMWSYFLHFPIQLQQLTAHSQEIISSFRRSSEELISCFLFYCQSYEKHQIYKKKSVNSIFRLLITMKKCFHQHNQSDSSAALALKIQEIFNSFSSLGIEAVKEELSHLPQQNSPTEVNQRNKNIFKGLDRDSKKTLQELQSIQAFQNLFLLLKFWNYSFALIIPKTMIEITLPAITNNEKQKTTSGSNKSKKGKDETVAVSKRIIIEKDIIEENDDMIAWGVIQLDTIASVIQIICDSISPLNHQQNISPPPPVYSSQIWRQIVYFFHTVSGKFKNSKAAASGKTNANNNYKNSSNKQNQQKESQGECSL